jgi:mRNA-degrading endonuclease toxin of MazEF toxin-antitoxin module
MGGATGSRGTGAGRWPTRQPAWALADQVRSVDKRRVERVVGHVSEAELAAIDQALVLYLGLLT